MSWTENLFVQKSPCFGMTIYLYTTFQCAYEPGYHLRTISLRNWFLTHEFTVSCPDQIVRIHTGQSQLFTNYSPYITFYLTPSLYISDNEVLMRAFISFKRILDGCTCTRCLHLDASILTFTSCLVQVIVWFRVQFGINCYTIIC